METLLLNTHSHFHSRALLVACLALTPSCAGVEYLFSADTDSESGFVQVDELLGRVERIHVDCELSAQTITEAVNALVMLVGPDFRGEPGLAIDQLLTATLLSEKQAEGLRGDFVPMQDSARAVFTDWRTDLGEFTSDGMRKHSEDRMTESKERYEAVVSHVGPALVQYEAFNKSLRDMALYLGNDFNTESVKKIEQELRALLVASKALTENFNGCTDACQEYIRKAALRGQVSPRARKSI